MGILSGFIGGTARAAGQIADQRIARYTAEEMARQHDLMEQEREKRIEEAQIAREGRAISQRDKDRTDTVKRIDEETSRLADTAISSKRGLIDSSIADRSSWTPEQQSAVDQALAEERQSIASNIDTKYQASVNTGDTSLQNAALMSKQERRLDQQEKKNDAQTEFSNKRLTMQDEWNKKQDAIRNRLADIQEARANRSEKRGDTQMAAAELQSTRLSLQSVLKDIATQEDKLQIQAANPMITPEQQQSIASKLIALDGDRVDARNYLLELGGIKKDKNAKEDPMAASIEAAIKKMRDQQNPQSSNQGAPTKAAPVAKEGLISPRTVDTSARDAEIAKMNTLSGSSGNRTSILSKKQDEIATNFDDKLSQIKPRMTKQDAFRVLSWFDENGGYMTAAQLKQVRDAKRAAGM